MGVGSFVYLRRFISWKDRGKAFRAVNDVNDNEANLAYLPSARVYYLVAKRAFVLMWKLSLSPSGICVKLQRQVCILLLWSLQVNKEICLLPPISASAHCVRHLCLVPCYVGAEPPGYRYPVRID